MPFFSNSFDFWFTSNKNNWQMFKHLNYLRFWIYSFNFNSLKFAFFFIFVQILTHKKRRDEWKTKKRTFICKWLSHFYLFHYIIFSVFVLLYKIKSDNFIYFPFCKLFCLHICGSDTFKATTHLVVLFVRNFYFVLTALIFTLFITIDNLLWFFVWCFTWN